MKRRDGSGLLRFVLAIIGSLLFALAGVANLIIAWVLHPELTERQIALRYFVPWGLIGIIGVLLIMGALGTGD